jgi:hypothetical protein
MTQDEIIKMLRNSGAIVTPIGFVTEPPTLTVVDVMERFAKLVAQHERSACAYRAGIALLGADRGLSNRVDQAIRARGQA